MGLELRQARILWIAIPVCTGVLLASPAFSQQEADPSEKQTSEPVFRVSKLVDPADVGAIFDSGTAGTTAILGSPNNTGPSPNLGPIVPGQTPGLSVDSTIPESLTVPPAANPGAVAPAFPLGTATLPSEYLSPSTGAAIPAPPHPLDRAISSAHESLAHIEQSVFDYTAILVKRESVDGVLGDQEYMQIKVRNPRQTDQGQVPFSVYMKFLRPRKSAGREVIYVAGQNDNKLIAHETGTIIRLRRIYLDPTGWVAMRGNRHPITDAGLENLVKQLIQKAERDRAAGNCTTNYVDDAMINERPCTLIEVIHAEQRVPYEFHKAQVFIDQELGVPVRFASYGWPRVSGEEPPLQEEYTYVNIAVNVGLQNEDFSPDNPAYAFPKK